MYTAPSHYLTSHRSSECHSTRISIVDRNVKMSSTGEKHGWTAVPRSLEQLVESRTNPQPSTPTTADEITIPDTSLAQQVMKYAKENLSKETFNHSMRVYLFGSLS